MPLRAITDRARSAPITSQGLSPHQPHELRGYQGQSPFAPGKCEWFEHEVRPRLRGRAAEIRYADDFILCFQYREDAERVLAVLTKRFAKYGLTLHPEKTRMLA